MIVRNETKVYPIALCSSFMTDQEKAYSSLGIDVPVQDSLIEKRPHVLQCSSTAENTFRASGVLMVFHLARIERVH